MLDDFLGLIAWFIGSLQGLSHGTTVFGAAVVAAAAALLTIRLVARRRRWLRHEAPEMAASLERPDAKHPEDQADPPTTPPAASRPVTAAAALEARAVRITKTFRLFVSSTFA